MRSLIGPMSDVLGIGMLFWLSDAILLATRGRGELNTLHVIVALGASSLICIVSVLLMRRYRGAILLIVILAVAMAWLVVFGPAIPSVRAAILAILVVVTVAAIAGWLPPERLVIVIPLLLLLHHIVITRQLPSIITIGAAGILTPVQPPLYRFLRVNRPVLLVAGVLSIAAGVAAGNVLSRHVDSRSWNSRLSTANQSRRANIILIVIDTLRADRVGSYGYQVRPSTPFLNLFAQDATVFSRAYSSTSWTIPAVASIFTGLTCGQHGVVNGGGALPADHPTIAEILRGNGYFTSGISANFALDDQTGFTRGFNRYSVLWRLVRGNRTAVPSLWDDLNSVLISYYRGWIAPLPGWNWKPRAEDVTQRAIAALAEAPRDRPLFLYVQYVDPHAPCDAVSHDRWRVTAPDRVFDEKWSLEYDREIRDLDTALAILVANIDRSLDPHNTLLIIVADHGEQLGEEGERGHGRNLSEATIRVPLIVRFPTTAIPPKADMPFSTARVFDLMRAAARLPVSDRDATVANSSLALGNSLQRAVTNGRYKLVQHWQLDPPQLVREALYVLPDEKHDLLAQNRAVADFLRSAAVADPLPRDFGDRMTDEMRAKFRALGYLH